MDVFQGQACAAVGREARTKDQLLHRGLTHLRHHGGGLRVGALGVEREEHGVVVAAAGQAQLGVQHFGLVIHGARGQSCQAPRTVAVVALGALHAQGAESVGGAGVVAHAQLGFVPVGIDLGPAVGDAGRGVAPGLQLAQPVVLGVVPGRLGKGLPGGEGPVALQALLPSRQSFLVGFVGACHGDVGTGNAGLGAGLHGDRDGAGCALAGACSLLRLGELHGDGGRKVAQGAQQFPRIGVGGAQQALQFVGLQVGQLAKALQLQVALQRLAHRVGGAHHHVKRWGAIAGFGASDVAARVSCGGLIGAWQQAAAAQAQRAGKQQRRPQGRRWGTSSGGVQNAEGHGARG